MILNRLNYYSLLDGGSFYNKQNYYGIKRSYETASGNQILHADDLPSKENVIIKRIKRDTNGKVRNISVSQEFATMNILYGTNVTPVLRDYFEQGEFAYIVMGYKDPRIWFKLDQMILENYTEEHYRKIIANVSKAIIKMNSRHIYYLDISPKNILVNQINKSIIFIDFSYAIRSPTPLNEHLPPFKFEIGFLPAEAYTYQIYFMDYCQVFSIGALVYLCVFLEKPFTDFRDVISNRWKLPDKRYSNDASEVIFECMRTFPNERIKLIQLKELTWFDITWNLDFIEDNDV